MLCSFIPVLRRLTATTPPPDGVSCKEVKNGSTHVEPFRALTFSRELVSAGHTNILKYVGMSFSGGRERKFIYKKPPSLIRPSLPLRRSRQATEDCAGQKPTSQIPIYSAFSFFQFYFFFCQIKFYNKDIKKTFLAQYPVPVL